MIVASRLGSPLTRTSPTTCTPPPLNAGGIDAKDAGTITGVVRFKGTKPEAKPIEEIAGNSFCQTHYDGELPLHDRFVFGKNGNDDTLVNVLVYVSKGLEGKKFERQGAGDSGSGRGACIRRTWWR